MAANPVARQLTPILEPLKLHTTIPAINTEKSGEPLTNVIPKHLIN